MTNYRRNRVPGGTFFFTVAIAERHLDLLVRPIVHFKAVLRDEQQRAPFVNLGLAAAAGSSPLCCSLAHCGDVPFSRTLEDG